MTRHVVPALLTAVLLTACQDDQALPFEQQSSTRSVPASGGTVSTPAGAAIIFPSGSLPGTTSITLAPLSLSAGASAIGVPSSDHSMRIDPAGQVLNTPATLETELTSTNADRWLSVQLLESPSGKQVFADGDVDLTNNILRTQVTRLGTFTPILPPASARFPVTPAALALSTPATLAAGGAKTLSKTCGTFNASGAYVPCPGLSYTASANVLAKYDNLQGVFPQISGPGLVFASDPTTTASTVTGSITGFTPYRVLSEDGTTATTFTVTIVVTATTATRATQVGNALTLTNVQVSTTWSGDTDAPEVTTKSVTFTVSGSTATMTESRVIDLGNGESGTVTVTLAFDITTF